MIPDFLIKNAELTVHNLADFVAKFESENTHSKFTFQKSQRLDLQTLIRRASIHLQRLNDAIEEYPELRIRPPFSNQWITLKFLKMDGSDDLGTIRKLEMALPRLIDSLSKLEPYTPSLPEIDPLPKQDISFRLSLTENGQIGLVRGNAAADEARIEQLRLGLLRLVDKATGELTQGNQAFGFLADALSEYREEVCRPVPEIAFALVFALGSQLERSLKEARRKDADPEFQDLNPAAAARVAAVLDIHRPFMMSSDLGATLVAQSEIFADTPDELRAGRKAIADLRETLHESVGVFERDTQRAIDTVLTPDDSPKGVLNQRTVANNIGIVLASVVIVSAPPVAGLFAGGLVAGGLGTVGGVLAGLLMEKPMKQALTETGIVLSPKMQNGLALIREFTLSHRSIFRRTTTLSDKGRWFDKALAQSEAASAPKLEGSRFVPPKHLELCVISENSTFGSSVQDRVLEVLEAMGLPLEYTSRGPYVAMISALEPGRDILIIDGRSLLHVLDDDLSEIEYFMKFNPGLPQIILQNSSNPNYPDLSHLRLPGVTVIELGPAGSLDQTVREIEIVFEAHREAILNASPLRARLQ